MSSRTPFLLLALVFWLSCLSVVDASVVINEFVASNRTGLLDGDGSASDWIELYNDRAATIPLAGWCLTDDPGDLQKWSFPPGVMLAGHGYLVVFASGRPEDNYVDKKGNLHTNFALSADGEYLALVDSTGAVVQEYAPSFPPQRADTSYGLWLNTPSYFAVPTPGQANSAPLAGLVGQTVHSPERGFYDKPFDLQISCDTPGAIIRYTLDGSEPTLLNGHTCDPAHPIAVTTTAIVRSAAFKTGWQPADVVTHTYLFLEDVLHQPEHPAGYPSTWAGNPADYAMDPEITTDTDSPHFDPTVKDALLSIPTMSLVLDPGDLMDPVRGIYQHPHERASDDRWERPVSVEYILPAGMEAPDPSGAGFQVNCGVKIQGESSARDYEGKHTFRLLFESRYGPAELNYKLFRDSPMERFNTLSLRCCSTDSWHFKDGGSRYRRWDSQYIRDVWMRDTLGAMGQLSTHSTYVHLYVNGLYWGLYNPSERPDDAFQYEYDQLTDAPQSTDPADWDVVKDFNAELFRGNRDAWNELMAQCGAGLGTESAYQRIQGNNPDGTRNPDYPILLDVDNLIDYMILHLYACAEDWPHHNWYGARSRTDASRGWRFFVWDQEIVLDFVFRNRINVNNTDSPAYVYNALRANPEFRLRFADHVYRQMFNGGPLSDEGARRIWSARADEIDRAIIGESARWGDFRMDVPDPSHSPAELYTREDHWLPEKQKILDEYIPESHRLALERFRSAGLYPDIDPPVYRIDGVEQYGGHAVTGAELSMVNPNGKGTVYYTLDGTDPGGRNATSQQFSEDVLVGEQAAKRVLVPTSDIGQTWTSRSFDDSGWISGTGGVGYERGAGYESFFDVDVQTQMYGGNTSCYIRIPFVLGVPQMRDLTGLTLRVRYDDGFVAWLNGTEAARALFTGTPRWNSTAQSSHSDTEAVSFVDFDISAHLPQLLLGNNVLAVQGLNASTTSSDLLISVELVGLRDNPPDDGSDPSSAVPYTGPVTLIESGPVKARVLDSGQWSALAEATYSVGPVLESLRITELMYHPETPLREFIELKNTGSETINLYGVHFTRGLDFTFPSLTLAPNEHVLVVEDLAEFALAYDTSAMKVAGQYTGSLDNGGETIELQDAVGAVIQSFRYKDGWYNSTDGDGFSLSIKDPADPDMTLWDTKAGWKPSTVPGGSPGQDDP